MRFGRLTVSTSGRWSHPVVGSILLASIVSSLTRTNLHGERGGGVRFICELRYNIPDSRDKTIRNEAGHNSKKTLGSGS